MVSREVREALSEDGPALARTLSRQPSFSKIDAFEF